MPYKDKKTGKYRATKMIDACDEQKPSKQRPKQEIGKLIKPRTWVAEQQSLASTSLLEWSVKYLEYSKERHTDKIYKEQKLAAFNRLLSEVPPHPTVEDLTVGAC